MDRNPTGEIALRLGEEPGIEGAMLPVDYSRIGAALDSLLVGPRASDWDAVLLLGVAVLRERFTLEKVAINYRDPERPDNSGNCPEDSVLMAGGPDAYFSTLPIPRLLAALSDEGVPAEMSYTAGPFLCNASMYLARAALDSRGTPCGFVHLPRTPDMVGRGEAMEFDLQLRGVRRILSELR
jgi:pyroglutamyl-peptidase